MRYIIVIFLIGLYSFCVGQTAHTNEIDIAVRQINANNKLTLNKFNANEVYNKTFDSGGTIAVYSDKDHILKIEQEIGLSFGRLTTTIYLTNGKPIQIIDREENFKFKDDNTTLDRTKLIQVFKATIYVLDWEKDDSKMITEGKRVLSEGTCSNFEYEPLIDAAKKLVGKN
jgi:hypothetical protein